MIPRAKTALLAYRTGNIGDDAQSLSLAQPYLCGEPDLWVDRDQFTDYADLGPVKLTANGFFICPDRSGKLAFPPPPNFDVRYVALCASNLPDTPATREHLIASAPVGCRDRHTVDWCTNRDIDHYFASCPSILLKRDFDTVNSTSVESINPPATMPDTSGNSTEVESTPYNPDGPIVLVDVNPKRLPPFGISDRPFHCLTNRIRPGDYPDQATRFAAPAADCGYCDLPRWSSPIASTSPCPLWEWASPSSWSKPTASIFASPPCPIG